MKLRTPNPNIVMFHGMTPEAIRLLSLTGSTPPTTEYSEDTAVVSVANSRNDEQARMMAEAARTGTCPFCRNLHETNVVVYTGRFWTVMHNKWKYQGTPHHLVLVLNRHEEDVTKLTAEEWAEYGELCRRMIEHYEIPGGGIVMRFGNPALNGGTIRHLHGQIQGPDGTCASFVTLFKDEHLEQFIREHSARNPGRT